MMATFHTHENVPLTLYTDIELEQAAMRKALVRKDKQIVQLVQQTKQLQAEIDRLEAEARLERYARETSHQNGSMW